MHVARDSPPPPPPRRCSFRVPLWVYGPTNTSHSDGIYLAYAVEIALNLRQSSQVHIESLTVVDYGVCRVCLSASEAIEVLLEKIECRSSYRQSLHYLEISTLIDTEQ